MAKPSKKKREALKEALTTGGEILGATTYGAVKGMADLPALFAHGANTLVNEKFRDDPEAALDFAKDIEYWREPANWADKGVMNTILDTGQEYAEKYPVAATAGEVLPSVLIPGKAATTIASMDGRSALSGLRKAQVAGVGAAGNMAAQSAINDKVNQVDIAEVKKKRDKSKQA